MSAFTIRAAGPDDAEGIVAVRTAAWQSAYRGLMPDDSLDAMGDRVEQMTQWLRDRLQAAATPVLIGIDAENRVVGMCSYGGPRDPAAVGVGELQAINLAPEVWGSGLGAELLTAAQDRLAADGYRTAYLWVVEGNRRARRFYERQGWRADGTSKVDDQFGTGVTELRYRRALPAALWTDSTAANTVMLSTQGPQPSEDPT